VSGRGRTGGAGGAVSGAGNPKPYAVVAKVQTAPTNAFTLTPPYSSSAVPIPVAQTDNQYADLIVQANVGDPIAVEDWTMFQTASGSGLKLSMWSVGGPVARDWGSGTEGLQSVLGFAVPADNLGSGIYAYGVQAGAVAVNTVKQSDLDQNGNLVFRLYAANAVSGSFSHQVNQFYQVASFIAKNMRGAAQGLVPAATTVLPNAGANATVTVSANTIAPVKSGWEIYRPAKVMDLIEVELGVCTNVDDFWLSVLSVAGSSLRCCLKGSLLSNLQDQTNFFKALIHYGSSTTNNVAKAFFRVMPSGLDANGYIRLRPYMYKGSGATATLYAAGPAGTNPTLSTYLSVTNWGSEFSYGSGLLGTVASGRSPGEFTSYLDSAGLINGFYSKQGGFGGVSAVTATDPNGPWTLLQDNLLASAPYVPDGETTCMYDNGLAYIYYTSGNGIAVAYGTNPKTLVGQATLALTLTGQGYSFVPGTVAAGGVCKGPGGLYYMSFDAYPNSTDMATWFTGIAVCNDPKGPFKVIAFPLNKLPMVSLEWTGTITGNTTLTLNSDIAGVGRFTMNQLIWTSVAAAVPLVKLLTGELGKAGSTYQIGSTTNVSSAAMSLRSETGHAWLEYVNGYLSMLYMSAVAGGGNTPLTILAATSKDGVDWIPTANSKIEGRKANSYGMSGELNPIVNNAFNGVLLNSLSPDIGNPWVLRFNGKKYLYATIGNIDTTLIGTVVSDPLKLPFNEPSAGVINKIQSPIRVSINANSTLTVPANSALRLVSIIEGAGATITGGLNIGTTSGGAQVLSAQAVAANSKSSVAPIASASVFTVDTTLYLQAVTAWNGAAINVSLFFDPI
jgi:hypothetical protein